MTALIWFTVQFSPAHTESGEVFTAVGVPFWFDGEPAVSLRDKKGGVRISRLSGLVAVNKMTEEKHK
jgi:hypothetical protein